tara:strand:+ start:645 stop:1712 length:1068 start_codon:yes stop_codon:yes gene_type:complete
MKNLTMMSPEAYQAEGHPINLGSSDFNFLKTAIKKSSRNRSRICTHHNTDEKLHEMFVIYGRETYVRPNRHFGKDESVFVLEGACDVYFFDLDGHVTNVVELDTSNSENPYFCRIPKEIYHTVVIKSNQVVLFEATSGPFEPADTYYANWSPKEGDEYGIKKFQANLEENKASIINTMNVSGGYVKLSNEVFSTDKPISWLSEADHLFLNNQLEEFNLDRVRICNHVGPNEKLHEMLMLFSNTTFVRPSMHIDREESLFIIEGSGRYVFFDDLGKVTNVVNLNSPSGGEKCYCRIPKNTYHMLIVDTETMLVKETTTGPFTKDDTVFPDWAPDLKFSKDANVFLQQIEKEIKVLK